MKDEHSHHRLELGRRLASFTTRVRIEGQGIVDLGEDAPAALARLYVAGGRELEMAIYKGRKVWKVWAAHAFLVWGCENLAVFREAFRGYRSPESYEDEFIVEAALDGDPARWRAAFEEEVREWEDERAALWALYLLRDPAIALDLARRSAETAVRAFDLVAAADVLSRAGASVEEVNSLLVRADGVSQDCKEWMIVADAYLSLLGDEGRASEVLDRLEPGDPRFVAYCMAQQPLALCLYKREVLSAGMRGGDPAVWADVDVEDEAAALAFWNDDLALACRALSDRPLKPDGAWGTCFRALAWFHVLGDLDKAASLLRVHAQRNIRREDLYEMADDWIIETGDREVARVMLQAALPRRVHFRSPQDFLEWADHVGRLLGDTAMEEDGIRRAEDRALRDDYYDGMLWDAIARAWIKRGRTDEAVRVLDLGEANANLRTLAEMAQVWVELGDPLRACRCLEKAQAKASDNPLFRFADLCALGPAWMSVLGDRDHAEACLQEAEGMANGTCNWCDAAEARSKVGDAEAAREFLRRAADAATSAWDIRRTVSYGRRLKAPREDLLLYLAKGEALSPTSNDLDDMASDYEALDDPAGAERCRRLSR